MIMFCVLTVNVGLILGAKVYIEVIDARSGIIICDLEILL